MKSNKANNDIDPEILKRCTEPIMLEVIHRMTSNLWADLDIPRSWGNSRLKTLWKNKGSKNDPTKYRGLSIGSTVCKLITNIILERLHIWYEAQLTDHQNGFRKNRGTTDGIFTLKRTQQITNRKNQPLFLLFVDLTAAFDHIPRKWLFESIKKRFPTDTYPRLFQILENLYKQTSLTCNNGETTFDTSSGVRQGGPESPFLFNLYIDLVMRVFLTECNSKDLKFYEHCYRISLRSIRREERLQMRNSGLKSSGTATLSWSGYVDDLILFLCSKTDLQTATAILDRIFAQYGLSINENKTETMVLNNLEP